MSDKVKDEKASGEKISVRPRSAMIRARIGLRRFYHDIPLRMRWLVIILSSIAFVSSVILFIVSNASSPEKKQVPKEKIVDQAEKQLHSLVIAASNLRDTLNADSLFIEEITTGAQTPKLFDHIHTLDSLSENNFSEVLQESDKNSYLRARGIAYYDAGKHLTAWSASRVGTPNFDSLFSYDQLLEKHSKTVLLDNEQIFSWVVATRKIISKEGALLGYVTAKAMLGERFPLGGSEDHPLTIFDNVVSNSGRDVVFSFPPIDSSEKVKFYPLYLDQNDSTSIAGYLHIGDAEVAGNVFIENVIRYIRDLSFVLFIFIFIWILGWYIARTGSHTKLLKQKLFSTGGLLSILVVGRLILALTTALSAILPQSFQDSQDFSTPSLLGLLINPLQLFITVLFATTFFALVWVIFVPEHQDWKFIPPEGDEEPEPFSTSRWLAKIGLIIGIILLLPVINIIFSFITSSLVMNGSFHYLGNRFGFSRGAFVLMQASFLLTGLSYFFVSLMTLLWILRSMIRFTASELSPSRSYLAHYIFFTIFTILAVWLFSPNVLSIYPEIYWVISCFLLSLVTIIIFVRDLSQLRLPQRGPSLFYRIPRSGLALLFLLCAGGFIMSPLIATQEYADEKEIVIQNLRQNSEVNTLNSASAVEQIFVSFNEGGATSSLVSTQSDIRNLAFNIWLKKFSEVPDHNVTIEVQDIHGKTLSHFTQNATSEDEGGLKRIKDSLFSALMQGNQKTYLISSEPCFTPSCTPATFGAGFITIANVKRNGVPDSLSGMRLILSIALWNDLFPKQTNQSLYDIVRTSPQEEKLPTQDQNAIYGQYKNDVLQNTSATTIELPSYISDNIDTTLSKSKDVYQAGEGKINGKRSYLIYSMIGKGSSSDDRILSAVIFIPTIPSLLELTLSLNTVSLFIGFFVIFFALALRSLFSKGKSGTLKFRDRIFLIVLTIALVPLVIVTNITRTLLIEREQRIEHEHLQRDADVVSTQLQSTLSKLDSVSMTGVSSQIGELAHTIGRDISLYNNRGILLATNRPELYESSLLPGQVSSDMARQLLTRQKSFAIETLASVSGNFDIGYKTIERPSKDGLLGIVGVTSFRSEKIIQADIAQTIELMYGAFAALGIILLLIGAWISVRVAAPLQQLIGATERVTQGRLETIVDIKRKDEVGELAQAFNRMTRELERTRENVAQSEREGAWKEMARQVAHEIKNPLTPMKLSIQHMNHAYEAKDSNFGSVFRRVIRTLSEQVDVLTRIATEFSRFGEMPRRKYGFVSLKKIAESAMALYDAERGRIRFVVDIPNNLPPIFADDEEFRRALVNLIRNSLQATEGWGVILIRAREKNGLIHLDFSDTGGGMTPETLRKAFDPNFSTKTSGMGLGLAIVKKIITDMSGTISVESTLGKGTTFHIELPAREYPNE